jgi:hypothetical protein
MNRWVKFLIAVLAVTTAASVTAVVFMAAHRADPEEHDEDQEEAVTTASHISVENGRTVVRLDAQAQARDGIRVAPVEPASMRARLRGTAVVLAAGSLAASRNGYVAAQTKLERDRVALDVSRVQYERVKTLYEQNQNMSLKSMQDADAVYRSNQAQVTADAQDAALQLDTVRQQWGATVTGWVRANSAELAAALEQREFLVQVILPPEEVARPPEILLLEAPGKRLTRARYLSPMPQVNPQVQGISFLYAVAGEPGLAAGMNLAVLVPVGRALRGTVVPASAVVWWQGAAWVYQATSPVTFERREASTGNPVPGGYFVPGAAFPPGTKLVVAGAQALLSEEFRSQIQQEE